jgi:hypothetical protein
MQKFQDNGVVVYISDNNNAEFSCPSSEFGGYEPAYQAVPPGLIRLWTENTQSLSDGLYQRSDPFVTPERLTLYVSKIAAYQAAYEAAHQPPPITLPQAIGIAANRIDTEVNAFIFGYFNLGASMGITKRHTKLTRKEGKGGLSQTELRHITEAEAVDEWSRQVMVYMYAKVDDILACQTVAAVDAVTWDFEGLFGVNGTQQAKPTVSVREFLTTP